MKKKYLLFVFLISNLAFSQGSQLYHYGKFLNKKNKPENFLKILNKSTGVVEMTDAEGFAIIAAKKYDTLVWNSEKDILVVSFVRELKNILENQVSKKDVSAIKSKAYDSLIAKNNQNDFSINNAKTRLTKNSDSYFQKIKILKPKDDSILLKAQYNLRLSFNGSFMSSFDVKSRNGIPQTQNQYVQGRSIDGNLMWKGPETNELFSFGPNVSTLGFDGGIYQYDENGQLVLKNSALSPANIYDNSLFRDVFSRNNQLTINSVFRKDSEEKLKFSVDIGQQDDQNYFNNQFEISNQFKTKLNGSFLKYYLTAAYSFNQVNATNTNRIGLFNRVYQNSLLTPFSFSNAQNVYLENGNQRSYSQLADNPEFLFDQENKYNFRNQREQFSFSVIRKWNNFNLNISQSYDEDRYINRDRYKISTVGFEGGIFNQRNQNNYFFNSNVQGSYQFNGAINSTISLNHIFNTQNININNTAEKRYQYQRTAQDILLNYNMEYDGDEIRVGANLGNSLYLSNTALENKYWLPKANAFFTFRNLLNLDKSLDVTFLGAYTELASEANMSNSYAGIATTQFSAQNSSRYFPMQEVKYFQNLSTIDVSEWKTGLRLRYGYNLNLSAEYFNKQIKKDVFPIFEDNNLVLKNLANHTYSGLDFSFSYDDIRIGDILKINNKISFFQFTDMVDSVEPGFNGTAITGFSDVYKSLTEGQILGSVVGSYLVRDKNGQLIIDEFGFPKKADELKVIANPNPDFVMKFVHQFSYKNFSLDINWEWQNGGEVWNGSQAVLDYYGRSQKSADDRTITNFIFSGVNANGDTNQIPVDFYDVNQDVTQNRWTRNGYLGIAENYIEKADFLRINSIAFSTNFFIENRPLGITFFVNNILLWQAKKGVDPNQNFYNFANGNGLDFFNLPSFKTYGCSVSLKF